MLKFNMIRNYIFLALMFLLTQVQCFSQESLNEIKTPEDIAVVNEEFRKNREDIVQNQDDVAAAQAAADAAQADVDALVVPIASSQADLETATSTTTYVSPGRAKYHPLSPKAYVYFLANGTLTEAYGVTSVAKNSTGSYDVTWSTAFTTTTYPVIATCRDNPVVVNADNISTTVTRISTIKTSTNTASDCATSVVAWGDQ